MTGVNALEVIPSRQLSVNADKTRNLYQFDSTNHDKLLTYDNVTESKKLTDDITKLSGIDTKFKSVAPEQPFCDRGDGTDRRNARTNLKHHKVNLENSPK